MALSGWTKSIDISIYNNGNTLTNYQVKFIINRSVGNHSEDNVYIGTDCLEDYGDIRFTSTDDTVYKYWIESYDVNSATIWAKIPTITGNKSYTPIVLQYGNVSAISESSGDDTFEFFDDFSGGSLNTDKWTNTSTGGSIVVSSGQLTISGNLGLRKGIVSKTTFDSNTIIETTFTGTSTISGGYLSIGYGWLDFDTYGNQCVVQDAYDSNTNLYLTVVETYVKSDNISTQYTSPTSLTIARINSIPRVTYGPTIVTSSITSSTTLALCIGTHKSGNSVTYTFGLIKVRKSAPSEPTKYYPQPLTNWTYKRSHAITSGTTLTDYQIKIRVYRTEGTSTGDTVYLGSKCLASYADIRFVASDNTTELSYWMETNAGTYADFWVKIPSITPDSSIYIYYGNASATTTSNGDETFEFFDDFSSGTLDTTTKWTIASGTPVISNGTLTINNASITGKTTVGVGYAVRYRGKSQYVNSASYFTSMGFIEPAATSLNHNNATYKYKHYTSNYSSWAAVAINQTISADTFYIGEIRRVSTTSTTFYKDDIYDNTGTQYIVTTSIGVTLRSINAGNTLTCDWILLRKCAAIEPTHVSWSTEQEVTSYPLRITITPTSGTDPLSVSYNLSISDALDDFVLSFGDGQEYTGDDITSFATTHTYNTPGTYTVWAEGYNEFATHVYYEIPYGVTVNAEAVVASFTTSQSYNTITFTNTSTGNINECYWDFGDGNHSYEQNPIHTYYSPATYTVTLYASNQYQYGYTTDDITITQILTAPDAYFTPAALNVINPTLPYSVTFTNLSTPAFGCTYSWLIDGVSYTTVDTTHSFATYGMYDVGLTVTNALGSATKTYNDAIRITRKGKTFYEVINYADTPATFHVEVFNEVATSADTVIQAHIFDESINFVQDEVPDEPGLDEWGMRNFYSSINEWGHRIISAVTDWGNRILYNGSTLDNSPVTLFKAQEFREDVVFIDEWQFGTT